MSWEDTQPRLADPVDVLLGNADAGGYTYMLPDGSTTTSATAVAQAAADAARQAQSGGGGGTGYTGSPDLPNGGYTPPPMSQDYIDATHPDYYTASDGNRYARNGRTNNEIAQDAFERARQYQLQSPQMSDADAYNAGASRDTMERRRELQTSSGTRYGSPTGGGGGGGGGGGSGGSGGGGGSAPAPPRDTNSTTVTDQQGRERVYIDIPTDKEFLDDFRTSYNTFLSNLGREGRITGPETQWLTDNEDLVFGRFIAEQGRRAQAGEGVFDVINPEDFPDVPLPAQQESPSGSNVTTTRVRDRDGNWREVSSNSSEMVAESSATPDSRYGVIGQREGDRSTTVTNSTTVRDDGTTDQNRNVTNRQFTDDLVTRPKIAVGYTNSPTEWLQENSAAGKLKMLYEGNRLTRFANSRAGEGRGFAKQVY
jgi:hypothetical protein